MKIKFMLILVVSAFLTAFSNGLVSFAACTGHMDGVSGDTISGWAWNPDEPGEAPRVTVTLRNAADFSVIRSMDVSADDSFLHLAEAGIGTGNYGFSVDASLSSLPDGVYLAEASADGTRLPNFLLLEKRGGALNVSSASSLRPLGAFTTTAYCPCRTCSEGWGRNTSTGAVASSRHTIAVDPRVIPYGSRVLIGGVVYTAEDRGGGVRGSHVDIFFDTHEETRQYGTRTMDVFLLQ